MKIVFVSRSNSTKPHPYVKEQADALANYHGVEISHFLISRGGVKGYAAAFFEMLRLFRETQIDIVHVHYGLSGILVVLNKYLFFRKFKILITFHGSDLFIKGERVFSLLASRFASHNILVSNKMLQYFKHNYTVIPCGIDTDIELLYRDTYRINNGWNEDDFVVLFSSSFNRKVKDPEFAFEVIDQFSRQADRNIIFIELTGFSREQLTMVMQAADVMLMCSINEGSPQVIKEAILNSLPVISNDVGEVRSICMGVDNCFIVDKEVSRYISCLNYIASTRIRVKNRAPVIAQYCNKNIANRLFTIYSSVLQAG